METTVETDPMPEVYAYIFVRHEVGPKCNILQGKTPLEWLKDKYTKGCTHGLDELQRCGGYKLMGWRYDFRPWMKRYVVKQYDNWQEYWAPNKTMLRNSLYDSITEMVEIPQKKKKCR